MPHLIPEKIHFCGGCGTIQVSHEERTLATHSPPDEGDPEKLIYKCDNCGSTSDFNSDIIGYFSPDDAAKLRCL